MIINPGAICIIIKGEHFGVEVTAESCIKPGGSECVDFPNLRESFTITNVSDESSWIISRQDLIFPKKTSKGEYIWGCSVVKQSWLMPIGKTLKPKVKEACNAK